MLFVNFMCALGLLAVSFDIFRCAVDCWEKVGTHLGQGVGFGGAPEEWKDLKDVKLGLKFT